MDETTPGRGFRKLGLLLAIVAGTSAALGLPQASIAQAEETVKIHLY